MKSGLRQIFAFVPAILFSIIVPAQELPVMPDDPAVVAGTLPNGMSYYIAQNASDKGRADFALVQKTGRKNVADSAAVADKAVTVARQALVSLPRLGSASPLKFFTSHGSAPDEDGYVKVTDDATVFRFNDVRISDGRTVIDSVLLVLLDLTDRVSRSEDKFVRKWYSPADQAVMIAGDIDPEAVATRLEAMSYMTPAVPSSGRMALKSDKNSGPIVTDESGLSPLKAIEMEWISQRPPREYMHTVQPVIFDMSLDILGKSAVRRIKEALENSAIPYAEVSYRHLSSSFTPYDDSFSVRTVVSDADADKAMGIIAKVMSGLDAEGVSMDEYLLAEREFVSGLETDIYAPLRRNSDYIDRCISSFLYNSSSASPKQVLAFHKSRNLPDSMRCRLFNDFAAALIYPIGDPVVEADVPETGRQQADTLGFPGAGPKLKIKSSKKDHLSGGVVWTFSNGFRVVYKNMPSSGELYYTLALNGGYSSIQGLAEGEGAFVSDIFRLSRIAGIPGEEFKNLLQKDGISMQTRVTMSNTLVEGRLPKDRLRMLMRSLLALANSREGIEDAFPYYAECEELALDYTHDRYASRMTAIDSIMCPGYRYSPYKSKGALSGSFYTKADSFLASQLEKMNDGVFVIVGDIGEEPLKKILLEYVGGFRTKETAFRRPVVRYQPVSGWSTYTVKGDRNAVDVALSARMPLTSANHLAAEIAVMVLERDLTEAMAGSGMTFRLSHNFRIYPEERLNILISAFEADGDGMPAGIEAETPIDVLGKLREVLSDMVSKDIGDNELKDCKAYLKNAMAARMKDPMYWQNAITVRYLDGKDLTTGYAATIDAVTKDKVRNILSLLDQGCKVEYVTTR